MAKAFVTEYNLTINFSIKLYECFLQCCPDEIWSLPFAGWPVSHQYYHGLRASAMLITSITKIAITNPYPEAGDPNCFDIPQPTKEQSKEFLDNIKVALGQLDSILTDADLLAVNEKVSQIFGRSVKNGEVMGLIASHMLYHLGACVAALREHDFDPPIWER